MWAPCRIRLSPSKQLAVTEYVESFTTQYTKTIDTFATARIKNYMARHGKPTGDDAFVIRTIAAADGDTVRYSASLMIPLPSQFAPRMATGVGPTTKEAQVLAAMHAERILGALGVPVFGLANSQAKYVAAVGKAYAVHSKLQDPETPSPPTLCSIVVSSVVTPTVEAEWPRAGEPFVWHTMASPSVVDIRSVPRIQRWFRDRFLGPLRPRCRNRPHKYQDKGVEVKGFKARLRMPKGVVVVCPTGFGVSRRVALIAACMHAELLLDKAGVALFASKAVQRAHLDAITKLGRCPGGDAPPPLPIRIVSRRTPPAVLARGASYREVSKIDLRAALHTRGVEDWVVMSAPLSKCRVWRVECQHGKLRGVGVARHKLFAYALAVLHLVEQRGPVDPAKPSTPRVDYLLHSSGHAAWTDAVVTASPDVLEHDGHTVIPVFIGPCGNPYAQSRLQDVDSMSVVRLRHYFHRVGWNLGDAITVKSIAALCSHKTYIASFTLPMPDTVLKLRLNNEHVVCRGTGHSVREAVKMSCMHAEGILDHYGVALFDNAATQRLREILTIGRPLEPPLPLRFECEESVRWMRYVQFKYGKNKRAPNPHSFDLMPFDRLLWSDVDHKAMARMQYYLNRFDRSLRSLIVRKADENFYMATLDVPVKNGDAIYTASGVGPTITVARIACCTHAERLLRRTSTVMFPHSKELQDRWVRQYPQRPRSMRPLMTT